MIKIEIPSDRPDIAAAFATALAKISGVSAGGVAWSTPPAAPAVAGSVVQAHSDDDDSDDDSAPVVDQHGVAKDDRFCATARDPFFATGKRSGQWKKRKGVDDAAYDAWYASQLQALDDDEDDTPPTNTAAAFGAAPAAAPAPVGPRTCGDFMGWVAKQQAAGALNQDDIGAAYCEARVEVADLFGPDATVVEGHIARLYSVLSQRVRG